MAVAILSLLVLCASAAVFTGLRGRRIDDHPLCRRCGFDLTGRPDTSTRCSECGADLIHKNSVRVGHRRRRAILIASGIALLLPSLALLATVIFARAGTLNVIQYEPVWLLRRDLSS